MMIYRQKGFTLLEIIIYIGILAILFVAISSYFLWAIKSSIKAKVMGETLDNARRIMEIIVHEVKESDTIYTPTSSFDSHPGQLSLETEKYLPTGELKTYIDFYISDQRVCLKKESQNPICLTSDKVEVSNLVFSQIGNSPSIEINLTVDYKNPNNRSEYQSQVNLQSVASLRSY